MSQEEGVSRQTVIEILLVDDEDDFLDDVRDALTYQKQIPYTLQIVGTANNGQQALDLARQLEPDIIVMDLVMPGIDGVEAANILFREQPHLKVLVFSSYLDFKDMESIVRAGVRGYILKGNLRELIRGIERVYNNEPCFPPEVIQSLFRLQFNKHQEETELTQQAWSDLSPRERQIVSLHQAGRSRQEIAEQLSLTLSTVKTYFRRIEKKQGFGIQVPDSGFEV
ncbi:MAG: response regulator [Candidatus Sericytochromatia bacterium]